jgi:hypothetical protein
MTGHPEPDRAQLAADYGPAWEIFRRRGLVMAWLVPTLPPVVIRDRTVAGLRGRLEAFGDVVRETGSLNAAEAAVKGEADDAD